jgi:predicted nuclease with TOPRIM domain
MVDYYYRKYMEAKEEATSLAAEVRALRHELEMIKGKAEGYEFNANFFRLETERLEKDLNIWKKEYWELAGRYAKNA